MVQLKYRGVDYSTASRDVPSDQPLDHVYRGVHFNSAARHQPDAPADEPVRLSYRGATYETRCAHLAAHPGGTQAG